MKLCRALGGFRGATRVASTCRDGRRPTGRMASLGCRISRGGASSWEHAPSPSRRAASPCEPVEPRACPTVQPWTPPLPEAPDRCACTRPWCPPSGRRSPARACVGNAYKPLGSQQQTYESWAAFPASRASWSYREVAALELFALPLRRVFHVRRANRRPRDSAHPIVPATLSGSPLTSPPRNRGGSVLVP
jgi:hypothetical protein